jgi:predicted CXXCH cytochrome family protein
MTLLKGATKLHGLVVMLLLAPVYTAVVCAAAGPAHPSVAAVTGCVTLQCHARLLELASGARGGSIHQPAEAGDCGTCHDLALSAVERFVKGAVAGTAAGPESARAWDLGLCSGCHGEGLLAPGATATGFADGQRNLHALHVQAGRGRRCLPCHEPHRARQPKLLRERIPARRGAHIAQEFRGTPNGGWCRTGCHAPKSYSR